jgi:hypothetical protein
LGKLTAIKTAALRKYAAKRKIPFVKAGRLVRFRPSKIEMRLACRAAAEVKAEGAETADAGKGRALFF